MYSGCMYKQFVQCVYVRLIFFILVIIKEWAWKQIYSSSQVFMLYVGIHLYVRKVSVQLIKAFI